VALLESYGVQGSETHRGHNIKAKVYIIFVPALDPLAANPKECDRAKRFEKLGSVRTTPVG